MNSKNSRLSREEWYQLDTLIGKHGFGGYYDLVECLNIMAENISKMTDPHMPVERQKSLSNAVLNVQGIIIIYQEQLRKKKAEQK